MKMGNSVLCFVISGVLIIGYIFFMGIATSQQSATNVTGTAFEGQYNSVSSWIASSGVIIMAVALISGGAGVLFAIDGMRGKGHRR